MATERRQARRLRIGIAQLNVCVGDVERNAARIAEVSAGLAAEGADLIVVGEGAVCGYPAEDLWLRDDFEAAVAGGDQTITRTTEKHQAAVVWGSVWAAEQSAGWDEKAKPLHNGAIAARRGEEQGRWAKQLLVNHGPFDEHRWFEPGEGSGKLLEVEAGGEVWRIAVLVCADIWGEGPTERLVGRKAAGEQIDLMVVINASPYEVGKADVRRQTIQRAARQVAVPVVYVNLVGGADTLIFDGRSGVWGPSGEALYEASAFCEESAVVELTSDGGVWQANQKSKLGVGEDAERRRREARIRRLEDGSDTWEVWAALMTAGGDYLQKSGLEHKPVHIGVSGGVDSAVTAAVMADAIGGERLSTVAMPGPYSSPSSVEDAAELAANIGARFETLPIGGAYDAMSEVLFWGEDAPLENRFDVTGENLQARLRGMTLMALANRRGGIVIACGNRSEAAVGYSTLYGDMAGGYNLIGDVPKKLVWELAEWRNRRAAELGDTPPIPTHSITRPASAELAPGQTDQNTLGDYETLDRIISAYVDEGRSVAEIKEIGEIKEKFEGESMEAAAHVEAIVARIQAAEHKRRQAAPAPKISRRSFAKEWRMPLASRWNPNAPHGEAESNDVPGGTEEAA